MLCVAYACVLWVTQAAAPDALLGAVAGVPGRERLHASAAWLRRCV